jgi:hypothetical protein
MAASALILHVAGGAPVHRLQRFLSVGLQDEVTALVVLRGIEIRKKAISTIHSGQGAMAVGAVVGGVQVQVGIGAVAVQAAAGLQWHDLHGASAGLYVTVGALQGFITLLGNFLQVLRVGESQKAGQPGGRTPLHSVEVHPVVAGDALPRLRKGPDFVSRGDPFMAPLTQGEEPLMVQVGEGIRHLNEWPGSRGLRRAPQRSGGEDCPDRE